MCFQIIHLLVALFTLTSFSTLGDDGRTVTPSIMRATAIGDCVCHTQDFDEDMEPYTVKKGQDVGEACEVLPFYHGKKVTCGAGFPTRIHCPKDCVELRKQSALTRDELKKAVIEAAKVSGIDEYSKRLPSKVLENLQKKYPNWLPVYYNRSGPYFAKYKLMERFHFEFPLSIQGKIQSVTAVYFFQDFDRLVKSEMNWSFWITATGEILWNSVSPDPLENQGYVNIPCPAPAGLKLDEIVLYGISAGVSDAADCCGPYSLKQLKEKGPVKIEDRTREIYHEDVIYQLCGHSVNELTGKYEPKSLIEINGPANIRKIDQKILMGSTYDPGKAEIIGSCSDHAKAVDLGSRGAWHSVYCEGKYGWTHRNNLLLKH